MTTDELRSLDAEIHEKVMGGAPDRITLILLCESGSVAACNELGYDDQLPHYSSDIAAAWLVVEKLTEGEYVKVRCEQSHYHGDYCTISAAHESQRDATSLVKQDVFGEWGETMPQAICLAALKAVAQ